MNNIYDVAKLAEVSTATVSRVINNSGNVSPRTVERVKRAMGKLNYSPNALARGFASSKSKTIGLIMNLPLKDHHIEYIEQTAAFYFTELFRGVTSVIRSKGYYLMIINEDKNLDTLVQNLLDGKRMDGLIIGFMPENGEELKKAVFKKRPLAYIGNIQEYKRGLHVYAQYIEYLNDVFVYLKKRGHRHVAFLTNKVRSFLEAEWNKAAYKGYIGLELDYIKNESGCMELIRDLFSKKDHPTALFIEDLTTIQQVLNILSDLNLKVPEDVSIVSVEYLEGMGEHYFPKITNIYVPVYDMGKAVVKLLLDFMDGVAESYDNQYNIQPQLIERDSVISV